MTQVTEIRRIQKKRDSSRVLDIAPLILTSILDLVQPSRYIIPTRCGPNFKEEEKKEKEEEVVSFIRAGDCGAKTERKK